MGPPALAATEVQPVAPRQKEIVLLLAAAGNWHLREGPLRPAVFRHGLTQWKE